MQTNTGRKPILPRRTQSDIPSNMSRSRISTGSGSAQGLVLCVTQFGIFNPKQTTGQQQPCKKGHVQEDKLGIFRKRKEPRIEKQRLETNVDISQRGQKPIVGIGTLIDDSVLKKLQYFHEGKISDTDGGIGVFGIEIKIRAGQ